MAICKHLPSKNGFGAALEYLTMQHDANGHLLRDEEGLPVLREAYLIHGINCLPETFAPLCLEDCLRFRKHYNPKTVKSHQYILSFAPTDIAKGLTMEEAHRFGFQLAQQNFPGHRILVCTHPDGDNHSGNIHVHIIVSSLRFKDRPPNEACMRLRSDGSVKPSEYRAGCSHQDTAILRKHLLSQVNDYCRSRGYAVCREKAAVKISPGEYYVCKKGIETQNNQLRRAISDAVATTHSWEEFSEKLSTAYTRYVPTIPPIPYPVRKRLWTEYKELNEDFWKWDKARRSSCCRELDAAFQELKTCKNKGKKEEIRRRIVTLKEEQSKERLFRRTYQIYSKAAALALRNHNEEDTRLCLEQMQELIRRQEGYWQSGWQHRSGSYSILNGTPESRITWINITEEEHVTAQKVLTSIQEDVQTRKEAASELIEAPLPIEAKISRGVISFRHPDSEHWIRGKRLGADYTLEALGVALPKSYSRTYSKTTSQTR